MTFHVTLKPSGHTITVEAHENILDAALKQGYSLPYGCRGGGCGACKARVVQGRVEHLTPVSGWLTQADRDQGYALLCSSRASSDLEIECREIAAVAEIQVRTMPARVQHIAKPTPDVAVLRLKLPANERLQFLPGQYIDVLMKDGKRRSFSLASPPHDSEGIDLHVRYMAGGEFTEHVFNTMKEREILRFQGPLGTFFLREDSDKPIIMIASGTGFAPIKAILEHMFYRGIQRPVHLYWGARNRQHLYMPSLPEQWVREQAHFHYVPVLSEPLPEDNWAGRTGLVHQAVVQDWPDLSGHQVYACGVPVMVEAAHSALTQQCHLPEDQFFSDAFFTSNTAPKSA